MKAANSACICNASCYRGISDARDADVDTIPNKGEQRLTVDPPDREEIFAKFLRARCTRQ